MAGPRDPLMLARRLGSHDMKPWKGIILAVEELRLRLRSVYVRALIRKLRSRADTVDVPCGLSPQLMAASKAIARETFGVELSAFRNRPSAVTKMRPKRSAKAR